MGLVNELPELLTARCTGCGRCASCCPTNCLEMLDALPWLPRPRDCISCTVCKLICPTEAIVMESKAETKVETKPGQNNL